MEPPESPLYALDYFEEIFGGRTPEFRDLLGILLEMLSHYRDSYPSVVRSGDVETLHHFRHKHVTLIENLRLRRLKELSAAVVGLTDPQAVEVNIAESLAFIDHVVESLGRVLDQTKAP
jgi:hypothetical protein